MLHSFSISILFAANLIFFFFFRMMHGDMINFREDKNILFYFIKICVFIIQNYFFFFFNSCRLLKIINFFSFMCYLIT